MSDRCRVVPWPFRTRFNGDGGGKERMITAIRWVLDAIVVSGKVSARF